MKQVIEFARFYKELGYNINDAITTAINIVREVEMNKYENWWFINRIIKT